MPMLFALGFIGMICGAIWMSAATANVADAFDGTHEVDE